MLGGVQGALDNEAAHADSLSMRIKDPGVVQERRIALPAD
jgi:hypothetical protein